LTHSYACISKIHHAAFDAHLIGIDPDYAANTAGWLGGGAPQSDAPAQSETTTQ
jgi:predicted restriction endonuclease